MDVHPVIFSGSHSGNDSQSGEYEMWSTLFDDVSLPSLPDIILEDLDFTQPQPPKICAGDPNSLEGVDKKWLHKATERERRKDMTSSYSALRSLLPGESVKGKTSVTDQLSEAIEYIRHLQKMVDELAQKRDKMKKMSIKSYTDGKDQMYNCLPCTESDAFPLVNVNLVWNRLVVAANALRCQIVLSKLLVAVEEEGLQVLTATSFSSDEKVFHTVHCKVSDVQSFKSSTRLQQKLWRLIG